MSVCHCITGLGSATTTRQLLEGRNLTVMKMAASCSEKELFRKGGCHSMRLMIGGFELRDAICSSLSQRPLQDGCPSLRQHLEQEGQLPEGLLPEGRVAEGPRDTIHSLPRRTDIMTCSQGSTNQLIQATAADGRNRVVRHIDIVAPCSRSNN